MKIPKRLAEIQVRYSHRVSRKDAVQVTSSLDVFNILMAIWEQELIAYREAFVVLLLNRANKVMGYRWISHGGISGTVVDVRHIFALALKCNATSVIIAHNHPSTNLQPSQADIDLTRKIRQGGELIDILVLDHIIVTPDHRYFSFADEGLI